MPRDARKVKKALGKKGFEKKESHHTFFHLYVNRKKTAIFTKISHGAHDIGDNLLSLMARQLKISPRQFRDLIDCPLEAKEYIQVLRDDGHIE